MSKERANAELGGLTALAKAQAGIVLNECASTAVLLFGGNGYTKTGQGETVESKKSCFNYAKLWLTTNRNLS